MSDKAPSPTILKGTEIKPVRTPGGTITTSEPARIKIVQIRNVPDDALHIEQWQGVTVSACACPAWRNIDGRRDDLCQQILDRYRTGEQPEQPVRGRGKRPDFVDLSVPRRHGFTLASFSIEQLPPPAGYGFQ